MKDTFSIARDSIANIAIETAEGEFRVFIERGNPIEDLSKPAVNVWFDRVSYIDSKSNNSTRQHGECVIHLDCYAMGSTRVTDASHMPGDEDAARKVQEIVTSLRQAIMSPDNYYLGWMGGVTSRWVSEIQMYQLKDHSAVENVCSARITVEVGVSDFNDEGEHSPLKTVSVDILRCPTTQEIIEIKIGD